jgi:hypothetical protein
MKKNELVKLIPGVVALPDNNSHQNRMEIASQSSDRVYVVAQSKNTGEWQCSCPGWVIKRPGKERSCKHLRSMEPALNPVTKAHLLPRNSK